MDDTRLKTSTYRITFAHYMAYWSTAWRQSLFISSYTIKLIAYFTALIFVILCFFIWPAPGKIARYGFLHYWPDFAVALAFGLLASLTISYLVRPLIGFICALLTYLSSRYRKTIHNVAISPSIVEVWEGEKYWTMNWASITGVNETRESILLFMSPNAAIIIPKTALATSSEVQQFVQSARQWHKSR